MKWCRFLAGERVSYGLVDDERVTEVAGSPFAEGRNNHLTPSSRPDLTLRFEGHLLAA